MYGSSNNVWVCICIEWLSTCPPFCLSFEQGYSSWPALPPELLPNVCKWECPQWCLQLHTVGQRQRTRRPSLSSLTPDLLSMTHHVHTNTAPPPKSSVAPHISNPFSFSLYADEPSLWLQTVLDRICYDDSWTSMWLTALWHLWDQSRKKCAAK